MVRLTGYVLLEQSERGRCGASMLNNNNGVDANSRQYPAQFNAGHLSGAVAVCLEASDLIACVVSLCHTRMCLPCLLCDRPARNTGKL